MSYKKIGDYVVGGFIGALGFFNSSKLELRQEVNSNAELLFQNGQIVSAALVFVCLAGILGEYWFMKEMKKHHPRKELINIQKFNKKIKREKNESRKRVMSEKFDPIPQDDPSFQNRNKERINIPIFDKVSQLKNRNKNRDNKRDMNEKNV